MKHGWFNQAKMIALDIKGNGDSEKFRELVATIYDGLKEETGENPCFEEVESEIQTFLPRKVLYKVFGKGLLRLYYNLARAEKEDKPKEFIIPLFVRKWDEEARKTKSSE